MSEFIIAPRAELDLIEIWEYIARGGVDAADRVLAEIRREMRFIADNPGIGHYRADLTDEPLRFWLMHSYFIIYRADVQPLQIARVLSRFRNIKRILE